MAAVLEYVDARRVEPDEIVELGSMDLSLKGYVAPSRLRKLSPEGAERKLRLAGEGAFWISEFAVAEVAAALGMNEQAARHYVGQLIELRDRLPRTHAQVVAGRVPVWKARQVAQETIPLNSDAADYVDRQLARFVHKLSLSRILKAVKAAMLRHDRPLAREQARKARERRGVWTDAELEGVSTIHAVVDTPDAAGFEKAVASVATTLGELGDTHDLTVRRAKAVGILADPQHALNLAATMEAVQAGEGAREDGAVPRRRQKAGGGPVLHIHLHTAATELGIGPVARVDGYGPRCREVIESWVAGLAPGARINVTPVVDLNEYLQVDAYEAPLPIRRAVEERDLCCAFPWCGRAGLFDLDHLEEYVLPEKGGPPGQTNTFNLGKLCRFHHRVKTHSAWTSTLR